MTQLTERKLAVREAKAKRYIDRKIGEAAQELSRRGDVKAKVELCNEALFAFVTKLYERDSEGEWLFVDIKTYRILITKPWGGKGWRYGNLRRAEARTLSKILLARVKSGKPVLFDFSFDTREWYLNVSQFRSKEVALNYLEHYPVTAKEWRLQADKVR